MIKSWMWKQRSFREQHQGDEGNGGTGGAAAATDSNASTDEGSGENDGQNDEGEAGEGSGTEGAANDGAEDEQVVITLGDEAPPADDEEFRAAPAWVKDLRKRASDLARENRELKQARQSNQQAAPAAPAIGEKPTLESCDYDADQFEQKLTAWHDAKRKADEQEAAARQEREAAQASWQKKLDGYRAAGAALKVPDFVDAESVVLDTLSQLQQNILVSGAENPAALVYALGKNPAEAKKLAAITDPVQYAFAAAKLETKLKVQPRKAPPAAERVVRGNAGAATGMDNTLARLQAEADKSGDRSAVVKYLRDKSKAAA